MIFMLKFLQTYNFIRIKFLFFLFFMLMFLPIGLIPTKGKTERNETQPALLADSFSLEFSTYLGGSDFEDEFGVAAASDGSCYVIGETMSSNFPTENAYDSTLSGSNDAYIAKFSATGSLLWSTFFGGSGNENGYGIAVSDDESCYISGTTYSSDFPAVNGYNDTFGGCADVFVAKFSSSGSLLWSTYLGGGLSDYARAIAVASDGSCYVTGYTFSKNFPTLNAYNDMYNNDEEAFVSKFSSSGTLLWSTYLGGSARDSGQGIAVADDNGCYVTGDTWSGDFPTLNAYDDTIGGPGEVFITKFSVDGSLQWSTFFGGDDYDVSKSIDCANDDYFYLTGYTWSTNFPTMNAYDAFGESGIDAFVSKFSESGNPIWSTYLGGPETDTAAGISVASDGSCFVTGRTESGTFPTLNAYNSTYGTNSDAYITKFSSDGSLLSSSFLGNSGYDYGVGVATSDDGGCFVIGNTESSNFPTLNAYNETYGGSKDAFVMRFYDESIKVPAFGFISFIIIMPIILLLRRRKRK